MSEQQCWICVGPKKCSPYYLCDDCQARSIEEAKRERIAVEVAALSLRNKAASVRRAQKRKK